MVNIIEVISAVIIPALSLLVTAIGLRCEIKIKQSEQHSSEKDKCEQLERDLLVERNGRHDEIIKYLHDDLNRFRDEFNDLRSIVNNITIELKILKYDINNLREQQSMSEEHSSNVEHDIEKVLADSLFRYAGELSIRELEKPTFELNKGGIKNDI